MNKEDNILEDTIEAKSDKRALEGHHLATTTVASLDLSPGQYDITIELE